jgi:4-hydroxy-2-oxoheptanedioate aldolase
MGATFIAVGLDSNLLVRGTTALVQRFKGAPGTPKSQTY